MCMYMYVYIYICIYTFTYCIIYDILIYIMISCGFVNYHTSFAEIYRLIHCRWLWNLRMYWCPGMEAPHAATEECNSA